MKELPKCVRFCLCVFAGDHRWRQEVHDPQGHQGPRIPQGLLLQGQKERRTRPHQRVADPEDRKGTAL